MGTMTVIGTFARIGSGQDTFARELGGRWGWNVVQMGDIVREIAAEEGLARTREGLQQVRERLDSSYGRYYLPERVAQEVVRLGQPCFVTGIRTRQDYELLRSRFDLLLVFVVASRGVRRERLLARGDSRDPKSAEEFEQQDASERELFDLDWLEERFDLSIACSMPRAEFLAEFDLVEEQVRSACAAAGLPYGCEALSGDEQDGYQRPHGEATVLFQGRIFRLINQTVEYKNDSGRGNFEAEIVERSPGVRVIVERDSEVLLLREYRHEHGGWDVRLPGGKVFDTITDYLEARERKGAVLRRAFESVRRELQEETGLRADHPRLIHRSRAGATVSWDLLYFIVTDVGAAGRLKLEAGEVVHPAWTPLAEVNRLLSRGEVLEDRSAAVLHRYVGGAYRVAIS